MKRKYTLIEILVLIASFILFSIIFNNWDAIKEWLF
jgi:hypothetical protein